MQKICKILLTFIVTLCCVSFLLPEHNIYAKSTDKYKVKVGYGFSDKARYGKSTPVRLQFSDVKEDFTGSIALYAGGSDPYRSDRDIILAKGEDKIISVPVVVTSLSQKIEYDILDSKGKVVSDGKFTISTQYEENSVYVGILSDDYQSMNYMNAAMVDTSGDAVTKTIKLTKNDMPEDCAALNMFNMIVINNFNLESLNKQQVEAIERWVANGGVLLAGSGVNGKKSYAAFEKLSEMVSLDSLDTKSFSMSNRGEVNLESYSVKYDNGTAIIMDSNKSLMTQFDYELGKMYVAGFDLGQKEFADFAVKTDKSVNVWGELCYRMLGDYGIYSSNASDDMSYYYMEDELSGNINGELPKVWLYAIILLVYIGLIIPIIFVVLRKKDKSIYTFPTMAASAVVFSLVIYACGSSTRFSDPVLNYSRVIDKNGNEIDEKMYMGICVPNNKDYSVDVSGEFDIIPISEDSMHGFSDGDSSSPRNYSTVIKRTTEGNSIKLVDLSAFESKYFELNRTNSEAAKDIPELEYDINLAKGTDIGTVTNKSDKTIENAILFINDSLCEIGTIKPGESAPVTYDAWNGGSFYNLSESIKDTDKTLTSSRKKTLNNYASRYIDAVNYGSSSITNNQGDKARIIYFVKDDNSVDIQTNGRYDSFGSTLYTELADTKNEKDGYKMCSNVEYTVVSSGVTDCGSNTVFFEDMTGKSFEVLVRYSIDGFESLNLGYDPTKVDNVMRDKFSRAFKGSIYLCKDNAENTTETVDVTDKANTYLNISDYQKYVEDRANVKYITVRYVLQGSLSEACRNGEQINLPKLTGKGKIK